jgi:hypothetical protein
MKIDCIITSCSRHDLLDKTLESLFKYNIESLNRVFVYEDSDQDDSFIAVVEKYPVVPIFGTRNKGQIHALDELMKRVETPLYCGIEDDWVCTQFGFIPEAVALMTRNFEIGCVSGRGREPLSFNGHPNTNGILKKGFQGWSGHSWAPTVHRLEDYMALGSYAKHTGYDKRQPWLSEKTIGNLILDSRRYAYLTEKTYFRHIGTGDRTTLKMDL